MIRVERGVLTPEVLAGPRADLARAEATHFFRGASKQSRQSDFSFTADVLEDQDLRSSLHQLFNGRCAFCSQPLSIRSLRVGHYRPPQGAVNGDGSAAWSHYYWLAYDWNNLYPYCEECFLAKGGKFPTAGKRVRVGTRSQDLLRAEEPQLLDACSDDPEGTLVYLNDGSVVSTVERGRTTISILDLNRHFLIAARREEVRRVKSQLRDAFKAFDRGEFPSGVGAIEELYSRDHPFAGLRRQFTNQQTQFRRRRMSEIFTYVTGVPGYFEQLAVALPRLTNNDLKIAEQRFYFGDEAGEWWPVSPVREQVLRSPSAPEIDTTIWSAAITRIDIKNFMGVNSLQLDLDARAGEGHWTMLLGENGVGKTTVLKAIAVALGGQAALDRLHFTSRALLTQGANEGLIRLWFTGHRAPHVMEFYRRSKAVQVSDAATPPVMAFGPNRLLTGSKVEDVTGTVQIRSLFDASAPLLDPKRWIGELDDSQFDSVARALKRLLLLDEGTLLSRRRGRLRFELQHGEFELEALSAGYQGMTRMSLDMMRIFLRHWGSLEAAEGIVLIDEIGAHLHPRWQMRIVGAFRSAFPRIQVIASTHDPLCLKGTRDGEVVVLRRSSKGVYPLRDLPPVEGLAVDQLLTSEHFGLNSSIDPLVERMLTEFQDLLALSHADLGARQRLADLRQELDSRRLLGTTQRERLALEAADAFLGRDRLARDGRDQAALKQRTKDLLREIWSRT